MPATATLPVPRDTGLLVVRDDVLPDPGAYRRWALAQPYETIQTGEEHWHGIARITDGTVPALVSAVVPGTTAALTFFRQSPEGQPEPNFIHSDELMGDFTSILYLTPKPPEGDGTAFWRYRPTGAVQGSARALPKTPDLWERWHHVVARFNRLVVFDSSYFHSRGLEENYGHGDDARLIQVVFSHRVAGWQIREATMDDIPVLVSMGQQFRASSAYAAHLPENTTQMAAIAKRLIASPEGLVLVATRDGQIVGTIGVLLYPHHFSGLPTAGELWFWVTPEHRGYGVRLVRRAEQWAQRQGATTMQMIAPTPEVGTLYRRLGYTALEVAYTKELAPWP
jgi:GNAT superfamily N-acetyltransferase